MSGADVHPAARPSAPARFAGVAWQGQTWLNMGYVLLAFPTGLAYFVVLVVGMASGVALAVVIVGLGILLLTLAAWRFMAGVERGLARTLLGVPIPQPAERRGTCRSRTAYAAGCATR